MKIAIAALALTVLTGCSVGAERNEDAFLDEAIERASTNELMAHSAQEFIHTGDIACGMADLGDSQPVGASMITGIEWTTVWDAALTHLCP